ncbi:hypothetical protein [Geothrix sp.]|jgi:hypothetical protein|uniref:hypothetical protein n=1 Tax=Geothrix sp. TaxID=1962974 RepID=UPI0025C4B11E|nr:hypothetical protein [Geothrix sp.]
MPPGNMRTKAPAKVIERSTAEACISIARRVQQAQQLSGDEAGSTAAKQIAEVIREELLRES